MTALVVVLVAALVWAISAEAHLVAGLTALALLALLVRSIRREGSHSPNRQA